MKQLEFTLSELTSSSDHKSKCQLLIEEYWRYEFRLAEIFDEFGIKNETGLENANHLAPEVLDEIIRIVDIQVDILETIKTTRKSEILGSKVVNLISYAELTS